MLTGNAVGLLVGVAATALAHLRVRPDAAVALVVGLPSLIGLGIVLSSRRRWATVVGVFVLALAPGWLGALVAFQAVPHG